MHTSSANIVLRFQEQVRARPNQAAIITAKRSLSFAELERTSAQAAAMLESVGLKAGDAVLVLQPMSIELYQLLLAIFRLGLVAVFIDPQSGRQQVESCCGLYPLKAFVGRAKAHVLRLLMPAIRRIKWRWHTTGWVLRSCAWSRLDQHTPLDSCFFAQADSPALVTFTSGSTGKPKAAVRTHGFLLAQHDVLAHSIHLQPGQIDLVTLPIFVLANLASGVTSLIPDADLLHPGRINAKPVIEQIKQYEPQRAAASPAFFQQLISYCAIQSQTLPSFQEVYTGGAPVFPQLLLDLQRLAPNSRVEAVYGSTEAEPIAHVACDAISAYDFQQMAQGAGLLAGEPIANIQLRIIRDQQGQAIPAISTQAFIALYQPATVAGEIVVTGAHVLKGYLHGVGDADTKFNVDGVIWHRTGDCGYLDDRGRLWLLGRCTAKIIDTKKTLYPFAVETALMSIAGVKRAALTRYAELTWVLVEAKKGMVVDLLQIKNTLREQAVDRVELLPWIPVDKRHNAKIDYPRLHELLRGFKSTNG